MQTADALDGQSFVRLRAFIALAAMAPPVWRTPGASAAMRDVLTLLDTVDVLRRRIEILEARTDATPQA